MLLYQVYPFLLGKTEKLIIGIIVIPEFIPGIHIPSGTVVIVPSDDLIPILDDNEIKGITGIIVD